MRGMVFTELLELIEEKFGYDKLDEVIDVAALKNDGAYAATGNYPFDELVRIVVSLSSATNIEVPTLLEVFGEHLFSKLIKMFPEFNPDVSILEFIKGVESYIHVEVRKLYPDAELPRFEILKSDETKLELNYISSKNIPQLAKGLMMGASKYFNQPIEVTMTPLENDITYFIITRV